jgi:hypothetical protein
MTLNDLLAALQSDLGYDAIPSAVVTTRLTRFLNDGYRQLLSLPEMLPLRLANVTFTSLAAIKNYGVPQNIVQISHLVDTTSAIRLRLMTLDEFRTIDPQENSSGTPTHYIPIGLHPVQRDPDRSSIYVTSVSPLDITQTLTVRTMRNVDNIDTDTHLATVTLAGTTPVLVDVFVDAIQSLQLSAPCVGSVQLYDSNTLLTPEHRLASIQAPNLTVQYLGIRLWPTPSDARIYQLDGTLSIQDLSTTNTIPLVPEDFQDILADFGRMREYEYRDDSRFAMAQAGYTEKLKSLRDRINFPPDYRPRVGRLHDRSNNLDHNGVAFPSGRW